MIDHQDVQLACRVKLAGLEVAYTQPVYGDAEWPDLGGHGVIAMSVAAGKYTRASGSFLTDGFKAGMEITADGFSEAGNNVTSRITAVTALTVAVDATLTTEASATGKSLVAELPDVAYENSEYEPTAGVPWFEEQMLGGSTQAITVGPYAWLEHDPMYVLQVHVPQGVGIGAANAYADGIITLFAPRTALTLSNGDTARVKSRPGPFRSSIRNLRTGYATVTVSVPLRVHTQNSV